MEGYTWIAIVSQGIVLIQPLLRFILYLDQIFESQIAFSVNQKGTKQQWQLLQQQHLQYISVPNFQEVPRKIVLNKFLSTIKECAKRS
jgi:hypothetical protein